MYSPEFKKRGKPLSPDMKSLSESNLQHVKSLPKIQRRCSTPDFHRNDDQSGIVAEEMKQEKLKSSMFGRMMSSFTKPTPKKLISPSNSATGSISRSSTLNEELKDDSNVLGSLNGHHHEPVSESKESLLLHFPGEPCSEESNIAAAFDADTRSGTPVFSEQVFIPLPEEELPPLRPSNAVATKLHLSATEGTLFDPIQNGLKEDVQNDTAVQNDLEDLTEEHPMPTAISSLVFLPENVPGVNSAANNVPDLNYTPEVTDGVNEQIPDDAVGLPLNSDETDENRLSEISQTLAQDLDKHYLFPLDNIAVGKQTVEESDEGIVTIDDPCMTDETESNSADQSYNMMPNLTSQVMLSEDKSMIPTATYHLVAYTISVLIIVILTIIALTLPRGCLAPSLSGAVKPVHVVAKTNVPSDAVIPLEHVQPHLATNTSPAIQVADEVKHQERKEYKECRDLASLGTDQSTVNVNDDGIAQAEAKRESLPIPKDTSFEALHLEALQGHSHPSIDTVASYESTKALPPAIIQEKRGKRNVLVRVLKIPLFIPSMLIKAILRLFRAAVYPLMHLNLDRQSSAKKNNYQPAIKLAEDDEQVLVPLPVDLI